MKKELLFNTNLSHYRILKKIGAGGMVKGQYDMDMLRVDEITHPGDGSYFLHGYFESPADARGKTPIFPSVNCSAFRTLY